MLNKQIEELKQELNRKIEEGMGLSEVYELSVRIDQLITDLYKNKDNRKILRQ